MYEAACAADADDSAIAELSISRHLIFLLHEGCAGAISSGFDWLRLMGPGDTHINCRIYALKIFREALRGVCVCVWRFCYHQILSLYVSFLGSRVLLPTTSLSVVTSSFNNFYKNFFNTKSQYLYGEIFFKSQRDLKKYLKNFRTKMYEVGSAISQQNQ